MYNYIYWIMNQPSSNQKPTGPSQSTGKSKPEKVSGLRLRDLFSDSRRKVPRPRPRLDTSETFESEAYEIHASEALKTFELEAPISEILEFRDRGFKIRLNVIRCDLIHLIQISNTWKHGIKYVIYKNLEFKSRNIQIPLRSPKIKGRITTQILDNKLPHSKSGES